MESSCLTGGQVFGAVKMFGRQLPWDVDLDVDVAKVVIIIYHLLLTCWFQLSDKRLVRTTSLKPTDVVEPNGINQINGATFFYMTICKTYLETVTVKTGERKSEA